jgi:hypothetical protein
MNTVDDVTFFVKGKRVGTTADIIKALPEEDRRKAYNRMRALGSTVAGFASMEGARVPAGAAPAAAAAGAGRARSPSPKPERPFSERVAERLGEVSKKMAEKEDKYAGPLPTTKASALHLTTAEDMRAAMKAHGLEEKFHELMRNSMFRARFGLDDKDVRGYVLYKGPKNIILDVPGGREAGYSPIKIKSA